MQEIVLTEKPGPAFKAIYILSGRGQGRIPGFLTNGSKLPQYKTRANLIPQRRALGVW
jgi:hypothetical protein